MVIVDASVVLDILLGVPSAETLMDRAFGHKEASGAPQVLDLEVVQVLRRLVAGHRLAAERAAEAVHDFMMLPITRYPHTIFLRRIWQLRENLTAYDAAYVVLAEALDAPLLTRDARLATTSPHHNARIELI